MLLTEKVISIIGTGSGVDYLEEYLIASKEITITEAKELNVLVENALTDKLTKLKQVFTEKLAALKALRDEKLAKAAGDGQKISKIKTWFANQVAKLKAAYHTSVQAAKSSGTKAIGMIKNMPKKGKIGAALALGTAAAGGGYLAYKARQKKAAKA